MKALFTFLLYGTVQIVDYYFGLNLPALTSLLASTEESVSKLQSYSLVEEVLPSMDIELMKHIKREAKGLKPTGNPTEAMLSKFDSLLGYDIRSLD